MPVPFSVIKAIKDRTAQFLKALILSNVLLGGILYDPPGRQKATVFLDWQMVAAHTGGSVCFGPVQ